MSFATATTVLRLSAGIWLFLVPAAAKAESLPSWNDSESRSQILSFIDAVVDPDSPDFVPADERIAVFDNDGTLWSEKPAYFQLLFAIDRVKALAPKRPEWRERQPFQAVLEGDLQTLAESGEKGLLELVMATHAGMTTEEFTAIVKDWIATARHPKSGKLYTEMVYQPMLELLEYLRANGFKTYIVSGGGVDFIRAISQDAYGIPPWQVVGSEGATVYTTDGGTPDLTKNGGITFVDDKAGKPVGIMRHIGQRPIFAAGNSDGDFAMLEWVTAGEGPRFGMLVHHTDADREFAYDREGHIGVLNQGLDEAETRGWLLVDMAEDWRRVFGGE